MVSIKATFSSIEKFSSDSRNEYGAINNVAADLLSRVEHYEIVVDEEKTKISRQVTRMERMYDEIQSKVRRYQSVMEKAQADRERYSEEMDYIYSHPNTVTTTDDDGNEHTESVIDYDALNAASRARDEATSTYYTYSEKYDEATYVLHEASAMLHQCQNMKRAIELTLQAIQSDKFEIKKYIVAIGSEAEFNLQSLQGVITSLDSYLASKAIYMPTGSRYEEYGVTSFDESFSGKSGFTFIEDKQSNNNNNGSASPKKVARGIKVAVDVTATFLATTLSPAVDVPQQQNVDIRPKTEVVRSIDDYQRNGNSKQEKANQDYLRLQSISKKDEFELTNGATISTGGGDIPDDWEKNNVLTIDVTPQNMEKHCSNIEVIRNIDEYEQSQDYAEKMQYCGLYGDLKTQQIFKNILETLVQNSELAVRISSENLIKALNTGAILNQVELCSAGIPVKTNTPLTIEERIAASKYFQRGKGTEKSGYLESVIDSGFIETCGELGLYGNVCMILNPHKVSATFIGGDSLGFYQQRCGVASPIDDISFASFKKEGLRTVVNMIKHGDIKLTYEQTEKYGVTVEKQVVQVRKSTNGSFETISVQDMARIMGEPYFEILVEDIPIESFQKMYIFDKNYESDEKAIDMSQKHGITVIRRSET